MSPFFCLFYSCKNVVYGVFLTVQMWLFKHHLDWGLHQLVYTANTIEKGHKHASHIVLSIIVL